MAEVTPELMFEVLRAMQAQLERSDGKVDELLQDMRALRISQDSLSQEMSGMHVTRVPNETCWTNGRD